MPCQCDFCRAGEPNPESFRRECQENGGGLFHKLHWGPDPRAETEEGRINMKLRKNFYAGYGQDHTVAGNPMCPQQ